MQQIRNIHLTTDAFELQVDRDDVVQLSFGATKVSMTKKAALDFQYRLAAFIAYLDLAKFPYPEINSAKEREDSKNILKFLASYRSMAKL